MGTGATPVPPGTAQPPLPLFGRRAGEASSSAVPPPPPAPSTSTGEQGRSDEISSSERWAGWPLPSCCGGSVGRYPFK
eukprot:7047223-Alexandrium_andersonii.AAC.1